MYATMLVEYNTENLDIIPTTTIDGQADDSDRDDMASGESGIKTKATGSVTRSTGAIPQSLIDEFIFYSKEIVTQKSAGHASRNLSTTASIVLLLLCSFTLM